MTVSKTAAWLRMVARSARAWLMLYSVVRVDSRAWTMVSAWSALTRALPGRFR